MNKISLTIITLLMLGLVISSCENNESFPADYYNCTFSFADSSSIHPKAGIYQEFLDRNRKQGIIGATLMVKDRFGVWIGASGKADLTSNIVMKPCNSFLIASISKVFTATAIFSYIDDGLLSLEDPVNKWVSSSITDKIKNANESKIKHLLSHTSGIADYYTTQFELDRINRIYNSWTQEDVLKYVYGKKPTNGVGETYYYSNTNYLLLSLILEKASGLRLEEVYKEKIFAPLNLTSGYYSAEKPIPYGTVKGYVDIYGNGQYVESEFLYKDEIGIGGDGGIVMNAYDLGKFFENLMKGNLISSSSLSEMTNWFDLPQDWVDEDFGHFQNGYGLEHNKTPYGNSVGHTGGIDGFLSIAQYFPDEDATFVLLVNSGSYDNQPRLNIYNETLKEMFK